MNRKATKEAVSPFFLRTCRIGITAVVLLGTLQGQDERYTLTSWNVEDGLPQSSVRCIAQTPDGYLWIGTWSGLARFDGVRMTPYTAMNTPALLSANIQALFVDSRGMLWIGQDGGGLARYHAGAFERIDSADGFTSRRAHSIAEDGSGRVWISTELGVYVFDGRQFFRFTEENGLPQSYTNQVAALPDGRMYLGYVGTGSIVRVEGSTLVLDDLFTVGGRLVAVDADGALVFSLPAGTVVRRSGGRNAVDAAFDRRTPADIFTVSDRSLWRMGKTEIEIRSVAGLKTVGRVGNMEMGSTGPVFEDREGNVWLGKEGHGLLRLRPALVQAITRENGLASPQTSCGFEDGQGRIWIGTWQGGAFRSVIGSPYRFERIDLPGDPDDIPTMCRSADGTVWIGAWGSGLYTVRGGIISRFSHPDLPRDISIIALTPDDDGGVWLATAHDGLRHIRDGRVTVFDTSNGLSNNRLNSLLLARDGILWTGSSGGGINQILPDGTVRVIRQAEGAVDDFLVVLREDTDGAIWIGSEKGFQRWKDGRPFVFTERHGIRELEVSQLLEDDDGYFWTGAIHGLTRISKQQLDDVAEGRLDRVEVLTIGKEEGMLLEEVAGGHNTNCWKSRDGRFWFTTSAGAMAIDPKKAFANKVSPKVHVEAVEVDHRPVTASSVVTMMPGQTKIEFQYTAISLSAPSKIRFQTMLQGFDARWSDAGGRRLVQFTNLDPGSYVFRVRAQNNAGVWSENDATVMVVVRPPFYVTWWFRSAVVVLFLSVGPFIYWRRVTALKSEQERQQEFSRQLMEHEELERKRIAGELHDGIGQQLLVIKNRIMMSMQSPTGSGSLADQLGQISDVVGSAIDEVRTISHNLRPHQLDQLGLTKTLKAAVRNIAESTDVVFTTDVHDIDGTLSDQEEISLFRIVQEALNNILKHSGASKVAVSIRRTGKGVDVSLEDNGRGFSPYEEEYSENLGRGFGLSSMKERAKLLGWDLYLQSSPGKGTTIRIRTSRSDG